MSLFLPKVLAKYLSNALIPEKQLAAIAHWQSMIHDGSLTSKLAKKNMR
jgi:hypothetical protein